MRFVTITLGCDWPGCDTIEPEDSDLIGETTLAVDRRAPRTVLLCKGHRDHLDEILAPLLANGHTEEATKPKTRSKSKPKTEAEPVATTPARGNIGLAQHYCRVQGCGASAKGNVGLAQHLKKRHGMTRAEHNELPEMR